jgi:hypothetical protein
MGLNFVVVGCDGGVFIVVLIMVIVVLEIVVAVSDGLVVVVVIIVLTSFNLFSTHHAKLIVFHQYKLYNFDIFNKVSPIFLNHSVK